MIRFAISSALLSFLTMESYGDYGNHPGPMTPGGFQANLFQSPYGAGTSGLIPQSPAGLNMPPLTPMRPPYSNVPQSERKANDEDERQGT